MLQTSTIPSKVGMFGTLALAGISRHSSNARRRRRRKDRLHFAVSRSAWGPLVAPCCPWTEGAISSAYRAPGASRLCEGYWLAPMRKNGSTSRIAALLRAGLMRSMLSRYDQTWPHSDAVVTAVRATRDDERGGR